MSKKGNIYSRRKILEEGITYREDFIPLVHSTHSWQRLQERSNGELIICPTVVKVTENNIYAGTVSKDGTRLTQAVIRINYKADKWMFMAIALNSGVLKTIWIRPKRKKRHVKNQEVLPAQEETNQAKSKN